MPPSPAQRAVPVRRCGSLSLGVMVAKKTACSGQGDKQSKVVEQFAKGFVASSAATESEKQAQRSWDRSSLLQVQDNDAQIGIFNAYAQNANTDAEGKSTRRGLGAASEPASGRRGGMGMTFVSAGGASSSMLQAPSWRCRGLPRRTSGAHGLSAAATQSSVPPRAQWQHPAPFNMQAGGDGRRGWHAELRRRGRRCVLRLGGRRRRLPCCRRSGRAAAGVGGAARPS